MSDLDVTCDDFDIFFSSRWFGQQGVFDVQKDLIDDMQIISADKVVQNPRAFRNVVLDRNESSIRISA